jgi:mono/diheme cytochrome c family protein
VRLDGGDGRPPPDVQRVTLRFTYLDENLGSGNLVLEPREDGTYGAVGNILSTDGNWQVETIVRRRGRDDVRVGSRVMVASAESAGQPPSLEAIAVPDWLTPRRGLALGFMALGLALAFWISRSRAVHRRERLALYAASFAVAMIGGVLYTRAASAPTTPVDVQSLRSPFAPDSASLARGKQIYEQSCVSCHGVSGRGEGPLAPSLRPRPADFRAHMEAGHTDGELYNWLSKGVPGTAMPAFEGQLSEADRWHVINYIRGFAPQTQ